MTFEVDRKEFARVLRLLSRVTQRRRGGQADPSQVLIEPGHASTVTLTVADEEMRLELRLGPRVRSREPILLNARALLEIATAARAERLYLRLHESTVRVSDASDSDLTGGFWQIPWQAATGFPRAPKIEEQGVAPTEFGLPLGAFTQALRFVLPAASRDETRPQLCGVLLERCNCRLTLAATDTHRMAVRTIKVPERRKARCTLPRRAADLLLLLAGRCDADDEIRLVANETHCRIDTAEDWRLWARVPEGEYVNWRKAVPTEHESMVRINRLALAAVAREALTVAKHNANRLLLGIHAQETAISAEAGSKGRYDATLPAKLEGPSARIALNGNYLLDALRANGTEDVELLLTEPNRAGILREPGNGSAYCVLMPMQIV